MTKLSKDERQARVSAMLVGGISQRVMAAQLSVSPATITRDVQELEARLRVQADADYRLAKGLDLERIERLIAALWARALNKQDRGQVACARIINELLERKARMLGYDAPEKIEQAVLSMQVREMPPEVARLSDEAVREMHAQLLEGQFTALPESP